MAQIYSVRLPAERPGTVYGDLYNLGALPKPNRDESMALVALAGGLAGTLTLFLYAVGKQREAAVLAITGGIIGAFVGAAKLLGDD